MTIVAAAATALLVWLLVRHPGVRRVRLRLHQEDAPVHHVVGDATLAGLSVAATGLVALLGWGAGPGAVTTSSGLVLVTVLAAVQSSLRGRRVSRQRTSPGRATSSGRWWPSAAFLRLRSCWPRRTARCWNPSLRLIVSEPRCRRRSEPQEPALEGRVWCGSRRHGRWGSAPGRR